MTNTQHKRYWLASSFLLLCLIATTALGSDGYISNLSGVLHVKKPDGTIKVLSEKSSVDSGDIITTEKDSFARIKFTDGGEVTLRPDTTMAIDNYHYDTTAPQGDSFVFSLIKGGLRSLTGLVGKRGNRGAYQLKTPVATIGIRGTNYGVIMCENNCAGLPPGLYVDVSSGAVNAANDGGDLDFSAGQFGFIASKLLSPTLLPGDPGIPTYKENKGTTVGGDNNNSRAGVDCIN